MASFNENRMRKKVSITISSNLIKWLDLQRAAGNRCTRLVGQRLGQRHQGVGGHFHVGRMAAVTGYSIDDESVSAELGPPGAAMVADPAPAVVMAHDAPAGARLGLAHAFAHRGDDPARLVTRNYRPAVAAQPRCARTASA